METIDFSKTWVYNDVEVRLTSRVAEKSITPVGRNKQPKITQLYEISPSDPEVPQWKKWVRMMDLYEIKGK